MAAKCRSLFQSLKHAIIYCFDAWLGLVIVHSFAFLVILETIKTGNAQHSVMGQDDLEEQCKRTIRTMLIEGSVKPQWCLDLKSCHSSGREHRVWGVTNLGTSPKLNVYKFSRSSQRDSFSFRAAARL